MKKVLIPTLITIAAIVAVVFFVMKFLEATAPVAEKKARVFEVPVVEVTTATPGQVAIPLVSEGTIETLRETLISPQVSGRITSVNPSFEAGATFQEGELIAEVDQLNYQTALAQAKATLADARLNLKQEKARGEQAARDWKKIGGNREPSEMVLRIPFLKSAEARVESAQAMLDKAIEDLDRTRIRAPFDCRVREASLEVGAVVAVGQRLGMVYDPAKLIVRLSFTLDDSSRIPKDGKILLTTTIAGTRHQWPGKVMWDSGEIDPQTLSAYLIVEVLPSKDTSLKLPPPGLFVDAEITGAFLENVIAVPRAAVSGRNRVSVMDKNDALQFRTLAVVRSDAKSLYVSGGLQPGDRIILTKLELPVEGMKLKIAEVKKEENPTAR